MSSHSHQHAQPQQPAGKFQPFIADSKLMPEFTIKSILLGAMFGVIFGASTVYLALKAGLTVSASIPIAVLAISLGRKAFKTTILENNIIQTTGSAGESIAAGVVFTLPGFLFLSAGGDGASFFNYWTIFTLALFGGILGTLMMIPLRRSLIVQEHETLPYPEGTACASVLIAGEKGGDFSKTAYQGLGFAFVYATLQKVFAVIAEAPAWVTTQANKYFPSATINGEITPEYMGVGYIIGPRIAGVLVAGGVLAWLGLIPLLATLVPAETIAAQLVKLGYLKDLLTAGGPGGWDPAAKQFTDTAAAVYKAYVRQIGAGSVAAGGFMTLIKTLPTIVSSFKGSVASLKNRKGAAVVSRTENDLSFMTVIGGSIGLVVLIALLPMIPGTGLLSKLMLGVLIIVFGFFFVTVSSRIVGIIGSSSNPISGMTIATLMGTALIFIAVGWTGMVYEPMALVVGGMICIAAANAGATSQDLKTGYIVGATPRYQQISLFIGAVVSAAVIGWTIKILDTPTADMLAQGITHAIGTDKYPAPQGTLMATLIKGLLSFNLDWQFVIVGAFISVVIELCGVSALSFAVGLYLPLSTTLPIFVGGMIKGAADLMRKRRGEGAEDAELGKGSLFATGLVAGGALFGVIVAIATVLWPGLMSSLRCEAWMEHALGG
ncbi:MAG TPA: peptide transporter, partial [Elusimicrobia bacterium]|nr:peptide transporter [Elusimicrobiota bacterium]